METQLLISIISGCISCIAALIAFMAMRHVKRIDRHGTEINHLQIGMEKLDVLMGVIKQQSDMQAIEMKAMNNKLTDFIIDYHKTKPSKSRV